MKCRVLYHLRLRYANRDECYIDITPSNNDVIRGRHPHWMVNSPH